MKSLYPTLIVFFLLVALDVLGQSNKTPTGSSRQVSKEDLMAIKSRPLLVCRTGIAQVDRDIETYAKKIWTFNSEIQFHDQNEIVDKIAANKTGFAILSFDRVNYVLSGKIPTGTNAWFRASLKLSEKYNKTQPVFFQDITANWEENKTIEIRKREIIFALHVIHNHLLAREADKKRTVNYAFEALENAGTLAKKTLLIDEKFMNSKFTVEDLKEQYPFSFKIATLEFIQKAQIEKNKNYAYLQLVPTGSEIALLAHLIVDCEDGELISYGEFYNGFGDAYSNFVSKSHVEGYVKYSDYQAYKQKKKSK